MRTVRFQIDVACIACALTGLARADFAPRSPGDSVSVSPNLIVGTPADGSIKTMALEDGAVGGLPDPDVDLALPDYKPAADGRTGSSGICRDEARRVASTGELQVPAAPSSAAMFLSAVLSVGAWHALRSARQIHLLSAPEWFHTGGPVQVGHAVVFDFHACPVPSFWDEPVVHSVSFGEIRREMDLRRAAQTICLVKAPRGPPALA